MYTSVAILLSLVASSFAMPYITDPVSGTTCYAKTPCNVAWIDSGNGTNLKDFSPATIGLFVGSEKQQIMLQKISDSYNLTNGSSLQFTPDPNIGQNSNVYFIRMLSNTAKDSTGASLSVFSSMFTIMNMTGAFNTSVLQLIAGSASSIPPIQGASSSSTSRTSTSTGTGASPSGTVTSTGSSASGASTSTGTNVAASAAGRNVVIGGTLVSAAMVAIFGLSL